MYILQIDGNRFKYPHKWADLTLEQAMQIAAIDMPEEVEDALEWFEHMDTVKEITRIVSDMPVDKVRPGAVVQIFTKHLLPMVIDIRSGVPSTYKPQMIEKFRHKGKTYYLPSNLEVGDTIMLNHEQTVDRFIEASDLMAAFSKVRKSGIQAMPLFIASVVRERADEPFDEKQIIERADAMKSLNMVFFWNVFYSISDAMLKHMSDTLEFTIRERERRAVKITPRNLKQWLALRRGRLKLQRQELRELWQMLRK